jgi:hypothetical protein
MASTTRLCSLCGELFDSDEELRDHQQLDHSQGAKGQLASGEDDEESAA